MNSAPVSISRLLMPLNRAIARKARRQAPSAAASSELAGGCRSGPSAWVIGSPPPYQWEIARPSRRNISKRYINRQDSGSFGLNCHDRYTIGWRSIALVNEPARRVHCFCALTALAGVQRNRRQPARPGGHPSALAWRNQRCAAVLLFAADNRWLVGMRARPSRTTSRANILIVRSKQNRMSAKQIGARPATRRTKL